MVSAQEVHITINQGFQKVASNIRNFFQKEEIDFAYNHVRDRWIESLVRPRKDKSGAFELNQASLDDIQKIIVLNKKLLVYKDDESRAYGLLPSDYRFLLNDRSSVLSDCSSDFTKATTIKTEYVGALPFPDSTKPAGKYYTTMSITINGNELFNINSLPISTGLSSKNEKFAIVNLILQQLTYKGINVYWEEYRDLYLPSTFIIVSDTNITGNIVIDIVTTNMVVINSDYDVFSTSKELESSNRLINSASLPQVLNNNIFHRSIPHSPITNLGHNKLYIFYTKRFIVNNLLIDYIRKPRKLSLILGQSCELSDNGTRKCCDLTVEYLKNITENPAYQGKLQDNMIRME